MSIFQRFFGSSNDRKVKSMQARAQKINALEAQMHAKKNVINAKIDQVNSAAMK